jgi:predicted unusual protein kinase regulating ubiquinone biosynthesis (AarF/ABC1/UbiB family)
MISEGRYAERFAENFAGDPDVYLPEVHWDFTAPRTLTEENVAFLKVTDRTAMEAAGIDPGEVARKLFGIYMRQIFVHNLVHADPHPGNLFVRPLPGEGRFQVVFVDFGMVAEIPPRVRRALRHFLIGMGSRDAGMVVDALRDAGYLLPGADLAQLEEVLEAGFERFWGVELGRLNRLAMSEAVPLLREFGELLLETPVQVQADLMYAGRAVELLSALATDLDDTLNPWAEAVPFAEALAAEATERGFREQAVRFLDELRRLAELPWRASRVLDLAQRGRLTVRAALAPDARRELRRLGRAVDHLAVSVLAAALVVAAALVYRPEAPWPTVALAAAGVTLFLGSRWLR